MKTKKQNILTVLFVTFFLLVFSANAMAHIERAQTYDDVGVPVFESDRE